MNNKIDFFSGLIVVCVSVLLYSLTGRMPEQSAMFPRILAGLFAFLGIILSINSLKKKDESSERPSFRNKDVWRGFFSITAYVILMNSIGFFVSTALFVIAFMIINNEKSWVKISATAVLINVFIYMIFVAQLNVPLPNGVLF